MKPVHPANLDRLRKNLGAISDGSIGSRAVALGWISHAQLQECLMEQKKTHKGQPLGNILVSKKYLTPAQLAELVLPK